jgi:hypothetical protein
VVVIADFMSKERSAIEAVEVIEWEPLGDVFEPADPVELLKRSPRLKAYSKEARVSWDEIIRELTNKQSSLENPGKAKV